jgi:4-carboxymuconolactone decarboxylase
MHERPIPRPAVFRFVLVALGAIQFVNGLYALFAPRSFYDDFPFGRGWVAATPAYSEHLVRDVGGLFLATGAVMLLAAVWLERRIVITALASWLLFAIPHTTYHFFNLEPLSTGDAIANALSLSATVVLALVLVVLLARPPAALGSHGAATPSGDARIDLIEKPKSPFLRYVYRESKRTTGAVVDPVKAFAHHPLILAGYGGMEMAVERSKAADLRLKDLGVIRAAMLAGCEWCLDFGSHEVKRSGISDDDLRDLPRYRESERFSELDKLVLDYATGISRTPVDVSDEVVAQLREHLDEKQLVELTTLIALENFRARFNWALGIGSQGFSEGSYCVKPEVPAAAVA